MPVKHILAGALALGLVGAGVAVAPLTIHPAYAACDPGTPVDNTTADTARRIMMKAGYRDITIEEKGCDNVWHVIASRDGQSGRFAIEPSGKIYPEGN